MSNDLYNDTCDVCGNVIRVAFVRDDPPGTCCSDICAKQMSLFQTNHDN